jgi:hypothetical protein
MRKEPFSVGSYVHIMKRGARGTPIVHNDDDRWRFLKLIRYLNDSSVPRNWERDITSGHIANDFERPEHWPEADPYVSVLAYCLMDNHFHLLVQERQEKGVSRFMQRLCTSMAAYNNAKYREEGTLFQSAYRAKTVDNDDYLQYLAAYILVKNPFQLHPEGIEAAVRDFNVSLATAESYRFSSLSVFTRKGRSSLLDMEEVEELFERGTAFTRTAKDILYGRYNDPRVDELAMGS